MQRTQQKTVKQNLGIFGILAVGILVASCSGPNGASDNGAGVAPSENATSTSASSSSPAPPVKEAEQVRGATSECAVKVQGVYPCAGELKLPAAAKPFPKVGEIPTADGTEKEIAPIIVAGAGKLGCDIFADGSGYCMDTQWDSAPKPPLEVANDFAGDYTLDFKADGTSSFNRWKGDINCAQTGFCVNEKPDAYAIPEGEAWFFGDMVCGNPDGNSLTCWNYKTGHGAHMNGTEIKQF